MSQITRTVSWGDALFVKAGRQTGGLNKAVDRIRAVLGTQVGVRNSFSKLYDVTNPAMLSERDQWRAWLLLTAVEENPSEWGVYDDAVPVFYRDRIEDLRSAVHPLGLEPRTHWFPHNVTVGFFGEDGQRKHEGGDSATASAYWQENPMGARRQVRPIVKLVRLGRFVRDGQVA